MEEKRFIDEYQIDSPSTRIPKPSSLIFNSTGKLTKKHDSVHERLSLPIQMQTPGTPRSSRSKFVIPSSLSPFSLTPKPSLKSNAGISSKLSTSFCACKTPLRQGISSENLIFGHDTLGSASRSPIRLFPEGSSSPEPVKDIDLFCSGPALIDDEQEMSGVEFIDGIYDISPDMLRPSAWKNPAVHMLTPNSLAENLLEWTAEAHFNESNSIVDYFLSSFDMLEPVGGGAFSVVYKAHNKVSGKLSAIKKSKTPFSGFLDRQKRLKEVRHLFMVRDCPHCIHLEESWEQNGFLFIQTELCENGSLVNVIEYMAASDSRFTEPQIWNIIRQLSLGLRHVHSYNIVHLDLKPANVFIDSEGLLKIGDFGLSVQVGSAHDLDSEGDKIYMAPEVLEGHYDKPADVFSLGLIALELAADVVLPSDGPAWSALRQSSLNDLDFEDNSRELVSLIKSMIDPSPLRRPSIAEILNSCSGHCTQTQDN